MTTGQIELRVTDDLINRAVKIHGHFGPFLMIGLRMGLLAKILLKGEISSCEVYSLKEKPPYCAIDGLKTVVGENFKWSPGDGIKAVFHGDSDESVEVSVKREIIETYRNVRWEECESKALEILRKNHETLFEVKYDSV